jgi:C-terminal processing protease CtpA/Prc
MDRASYSATTFFALATIAYPNIKLVGDSTGGGGGIPAGGQLPNGWTYHFSISQVLDLNGNNFAEGGVAPDIATNFDWSDLTRDEIIDRAMDEILGNYLCHLINLTKNTPPAIEFSWALNMISILPLVFFLIISAGMG